MPVAQVIEKRKKLEEKKVAELFKTLNQGDVKSYLGNPLLKRAGEQIQFTRAQVAEFKKCAKDPVYFAEKYVKIVHVDRGLIPIEPYPYQEKILRMMFEERFVSVLSCRQSGKTTSLVCFILWYLLFNQHKSVAVLANKAATARMILARVQIAYMHLPLWLQQGVNEWNKGSFALDNGSSIVAASTSSDSIRGGSYSLIFIDEIAFIKPNLWDEFFKSTYPTISSGKETKFFVVSTPNGLNHFYDIHTKAVEGRSKFKAVEINWWDVPGRDEAWKEETLANMTEDQFNQEYGNAFLGSSSTLLRVDTLKRMLEESREAMYSTGVIRIFEEPKPGHRYIITCDCAEGGGDYSTAQVIDVTEYPYKQVAVFRDNTISHLMFPQILVQFGQRYNMAWILVESNEVGKTVLYILNYELEYDHIISTRIENKVKMGLRTTTKSKSLGCARVKDMIESKQLEVYDKWTVEEFFHFVLEGSSYEADMGHDDMVMGLVIFAYFVNMPAFAMLFDSNFRERFNELYEENLIESLTPLPVFGNDLSDYGEEIPPGTETWIVEMPEDRW